MIAIILVGGLATRLRPLTLNRPKALMPILNRPFLSYFLEVLQDGGIKNVFFAAGKKNQKWHSQVKKIFPKTMKCHFVFEKELLGTGGAIRLCFDEIARQKLIDQKPISVFNGDVLFDLDLKSFFEFHKKNNSDCSIALTKVDDPSRFGLVKTSSEGKVTQFIEKPQGPVDCNSINAGAYIFSPDILDFIEKGKVISIERDIFPKLLNQGVPMYGFSSNGYWNDIGTHQTYLNANFDLINYPNRWTKNMILHKSLSKIIMGAQSKVHESAQLKGNVCIGNKVIIGADSIIEDSIILNSVRIGRGVKINKAIIADKSIIQDFAQIEGMAVLGEESVISSYSKC